MADGVTVLCVPVPVTLPVLCGAPILFIGGPVGECAPVVCTSTGGPPWGPADEAKRGEIRAIAQRTISITINEVMEMILPYFVLIFSGDISSPTDAGCNLGISHARISIALLTSTLDSVLGATNLEPLRLLLPPRIRYSSASAAPAPRRLVRACEFLSCLNL